MLTLTGPLLFTSIAFNADLETLSYHLNPFKSTVRGYFSPGYFGAKSLDRSLDAFFKGWLLLSQPPGAWATPLLCHLKELGDLAWSGPFP